MFLLVSTFIIVGLESLVLIAKINDTNSLFTSQDVMLLQANYVQHLILANAVKQLFLAICPERNDLALVEGGLDVLAVSLWPLWVNVEADDISIFPTIKDRRGGFVEKYTHAFGLEMQVPESLIFLKNVRFSVGLHPGLEIAGVDGPSPVFLSLDGLRFEETHPSLLRGSHSEHHVVFWEETDVSVPKNFVGFSKNQPELVDYRRFRISLEFEEFYELWVVVELLLADEFLEVLVEFVLSFVKVCDFGDAEGVLLWQFGQFWKNRLHLAVKIAHLRERSHDVPAAVAFGDYHFIDGFGITVLQRCGTIALHVQLES